MGDFDGKVVIVTGAASGIGRASAQQFSAEGAIVVAADINESGARDTVECLSGKGIAVGVDVADAASCQSMVAAAVNSFGRVDILFNNAGISGTRHNTANQPLENWARVIDVNLNGVFYCSRYAIPEMQKVGGGVIVNTSSIDGLVGMATLSPYTAAKHAVLGLTKCTALEYGRENIRCVAVCPGFIDTPMTQDSFEEEEALALAGLIPNVGGKPAAPELIANMVTWLASSKACYVNGSSHVVDAGLNAGFSLPEAG